MTKEPKILHKNKKASFEYFIEETFEAGIVLQGTEVKSCLKYSVDLSDGYVDIKDNRAILKNVYIAKFPNKGYADHEEKADRFLLLHSHEIKKLDKYHRIKGYSIIPVSMIYSTRNKIKVEIAICKGKKLHDKRETLKVKEMDRDKRRED